MTSESMFFREIGTCFRNLVNISGQLLDEDEYKVTKDKLVIVARDPGETKRAQRYDTIIMTVKSVRFFFKLTKITVLPSGYERKLQ